MKKYINTRNVQNVMYVWAVFTAITLSIVIFFNSCTNITPVRTVFSLSDTTWIASLAKELSDPYFQSEYGPHPAASFCRLSEPFEGYDISFVIINDVEEPEQIDIPFYRLLRLSDSKEYFICCGMRMNAYFYASYGVKGDSLEDVIAKNCRADDGIYYFYNRPSNRLSDYDSSDIPNGCIEIDNSASFQFIDVNLDGKKEFIINNHRDGSSGGCDYCAFSLDDDGASYCNGDIPNGMINNSTTIDTLNKRLYLYDGYYTLSQGLYVYTRMDEMIKQEELPDTNMSIHFLGREEKNEVLTRYVKWAQSGTYFRLDSIYLRIDSIISFPRQPLEVAMGK